MKNLDALRKSDLTSLLTASQIEITVSFDGFSFFDRLRGCQIVKMIRQIQLSHPGLVVDFDVDQSFTLSVGNKSIRKPFFNAVPHCRRVNCVKCRSFYPVLLGFLRLTARDAAQNYLETVVHLPRWRVDRCKIGNILGDLKSGGETDTAYWRPLGVERSQGRHSVTIRFETEEMMPYNQFSITISCGHCSTNGCMQCTD